MCQNIKEEYIIFKSIFDIWKSKKIIPFPNTNFRKGMGLLYVNMGHDSKGEAHCCKLRYLLI